MLEHDYSMMPWVKYKNLATKKLVQHLIEIDFFFPVIDAEKMRTDLKIELDESGRKLKNLPPDDVLKSYIKNLDNFERFIKFVPGQPNPNPTPIYTGKKGRPKGSNYSYKGLKTKNQERQELFKAKNGDFPPEIVENADIENTNYIELYKETVITIKEQFYCDNPERIKKHPSTWFKHLLLKIKQNTPKVDKTNYSYIEQLWDLYKALCYEVGINTTIENFGIMSGLAGHDLECLRKGVNPEGLKLYKKMYDDAKADMVGFLATAPGANVNQMFISKAVFGLRDDTVVHHITTKEETKTLSDIPLLSDMGKE